MLSICCFLRHSLNLEIFVSSKSYCQPVNSSGLRCTYIEVLI